MKNKIFIAGMILVLLPAIIIAVEFDPDKKVSLKFDEVPLTTVLNMLAEEYNLNIVLSGEITGEITLRLEDVTLEDALNAILASNEYNFYVTGNIVVVKPLGMNAVGEMLTRTITLDYISPSAAFNAAQELLSPKGKMRVVEGTVTGGSLRVPTQLIVVDLPTSVDIIEKFIAEIDQPERQVEIAVRMIETNVDGEDQIGMKWPTSLKANLHGIEMSSTSGESGEALGQIDLPDGKWQWGKLSVAEVQMVLDFLQKQGNSKLISDPRITTLNNHQAEIKVTTIVPIQTINRFSEGGAVQDIVTFQDEEIGIKLMVTPHITKENKIILDVEPTVSEIIGYAGPPDQQKPITSERSVHTKITVADGESAILGGLLKENNIENEQKVFLLGSIPIIGNLFKHKTTKKTTTDLMIMITPRIVGY